MRKPVVSVIFSPRLLKSFLSGKISLFIFLFLSVIPSVFSQSHWVGTNSPPDVRYDDVYFINQNTGYIVWGGGKMLKTTDGGNSWINNYNYETVRFRSVGFFDENNGVLGTLTDSVDLMRTTNAGVNWTKITDFGGGPAPYGICGINIVNENIGYAVGNYEAPARFLKTTNKGLNWISIPVDTSLARGLVDVYFWSADSGLVVGNWSRSNTHPTASSVVLFTSNGGNSFTRVFKSTNTGQWAWKIQFPSKNTGYVSVEAVGFSAVLKTTNKGMNWVELNFPVANFHMQGIGFANENTGWVGKQTGDTYKTTNGGLNWVLDPWGQNVNRFRMFNDTSGYAAGEIIYKFTTPLGIQQISSEIPDKFSLQQNYPNPFNPSTKINWQVSNSAFVQLKVYDALGNEVGTLVNEKQNAGSYSVDFNAASLPSGVYFYKLTTDKFSETKKMLLIK